MNIKLNVKQFELLEKHLSVERPDLFKFFKDNSNLIFQINEDIACEVRDWAGDKLQKEGFGFDYNLNESGLILEQLVDLFYA